LVTAIKQLLFTAEEPGSLTSGRPECNQDNITDEEKELRLTEPIPAVPLSMHLETILESLNTMENDYEALFALSLFFALGQNKGISDGQSFWKDVHWRDIVTSKLIVLLSSACQMQSKIRPVTIELSINLLLQLQSTREPDALLDDKEFALLEQAKEESIMVARTFFKSEDMFLELFEAEATELTRRQLQVEYLLQDSSVLLPPTGTPMTGIEFAKRLPCGEVERARRAIRVFVLMRRLSLMISGESDTQLPLVSDQQCIRVSDVLDLNNADLIACTVVMRDGSRMRRFLVIDPIQLILVEPDARRLGWGVAKFVGFLQDVEVSGDKDDSRCLHVTVHNSPSTASFLSSGSPAHRLPQLAARFVFDDHIRCMAAKQRLTKGRIKARQRKMQLIARLLDAVPAPSSSPTVGSMHVLRQDSTTRHALLNRAACNSPNTPGPSGQPVLAFPSNPFRPLNFRRAPGFAVTGRSGPMTSDVMIRPRSSSAHTAFQRNGSKEAIPLAQLTVSGDHSTQDDDQDSSFAS